MKSSTYQEGRKQGELLFSEHLRVAVFVVGFYVKLYLHPILCFSLPFIMCRWHSRFPFTEVLWIFNPVMFMWHLHGEVRTAWKCLSDCEYDKLLSQRLSGRYAPDCGTSMRHHVLEKPRESPPWPCLLDMLVTCRTQSRWLSMSKVTLEPHPFWMLTLIKRSPSHTLAASTETVKLLSAETMERSLDVQSLFYSFLLKLPHFD